MRSLSYLVVEERPLSLTFANQVILLDILVPELILTCVKAISSLFDQI